LRRQAIDSAGRSGRLADDRLEHDAFLGVVDCPISASDAEGRAYLTLL
jgi:hypothetical protein